MLVEAVATERDQREFLTCCRVVLLGVFRAPFGVFRPLVALSSRVDIGSGWPRGCRQRKGRQTMQPLQLMSLANVWRSWPAPPALLCALHSSR